MGGLTWWAVECIQWAGCWAVQASRVGQRVGDVNLVKGGGGGAGVMGSVETLLHINWFRSEALCALLAV